MRATCAIKRNLQAIKRKRYDFHKSQSAIALLRIDLFPLDPEEPLDVDVDADVDGVFVEA